MDVGSCTIAIVMTGFFQPRKLPGIGNKGVMADIATWEDIWETANAVFVGCVKRRKSAGWGTTGRTFLLLIHCR